MMGAYVLVVVMSLGYGGTNVHTEHFASEIACKAAVAAIEANAAVVDRAAYGRFRYVSSGCIKNQ